ncbi:MAG: hypothetical protein RSB90_10295 [Eubacterium sp.]
MSNKFEGKDPWGNLGISEDQYNSLKWERIHPYEITPGTVHFFEPVDEDEEGFEGLLLFMKNTDGQITIINIDIDWDVEDELLLGSLLKVERAVIPSK